MIAYTPSKALKPGMNVLVTNTGARVIREDQPGAHWETVRYAFPTRIAGKGGTEIEFTNGIVVRVSSGSNWIVETPLPDVDLEAEAAWFTKRFGSD